MVEGPLGLLRRIRGGARTDCLSIEDGMYVGSSAWGVGDSLNQTELDGREMWRVELLLIGPSRG